MGRQREKMICLRVSPAESKMLKQLARRYGLSSSDVLRQGIRLQVALTVRFGPVTALQLPGIAALERELGLVGTTPSTQDSTADESPEVSP